MPDFICPLDCLHSLLLENIRCIRIHIVSQNRLYVISYASYLIFRRNEILGTCTDCVETMTVVDNSTELTRKAVLQMFRDPNILDGNIVIAVLAVLICLYLVSQVLAILSICGLFLTKAKKPKKSKKKKTRRFKVGQKVVVSIGDHYSTGMIHARNENSTWHIVFSNRDVNELKADIKATSTVAGLLDLSKQISNVTSAEIKKCCSKRRKALAIKNLLLERLQQHEVVADHIHRSRSHGVLKKLKFKLPKSYELLQCLKKYYKKYRFCI